MPIPSHWDKYLDKRLTIFTRDRSRGLPRAVRDRARSPGSKEN
ncbi:hypothetical protein [Microcoleus sp. Pol10D4]